MDETEAFTTFIHALHLIALAIAVVGISLTIVLATGGRR